MKREDLFNTKIWLKDQQEFLAVEARLLELGCKWWTNGERRDCLNEKGSFGILIWDDGDILGSYNLDQFQSTGVHDDAIEFPVSRLLPPVEPVAPVPPPEPKKQIPLSAHAKSLLKTLDNLVP